MMVKPSHVYSKFLGRVKCDAEGIVPKAQVMNILFVQDVELGLLH